MDYKDYYSTLEVERGATQEDIKRSYRKLARKYHPDVSKEANAEERFKELNEAYEVLKDPEKRAAYDQLGADWQAGQDFRPPPDWDQGFDFHGGGYTGVDPEQFSDFFEGLFGRGAAGGFGGAHRRSYRSRGQDTHARIMINIEDAYQGATRQVTLQASELGADGRPQVRQRTMNIKIPKGIAPGQQIRLAGQGDSGVSGGSKGDLYLEVEFQPHPLYHLDGKDVYLDLPVAPWELALGATVRVPTPAGSIDLKIPANSQPGRSLRLKARGLPSKTPGDFYVLLQAAIPSANSAAEKAAYQAFKDAFEFNPRSGMGE